MTARPDTATYFGSRTAVYDSRYEAQNADGHALRARMAVVLEALDQGAGELLDAGMGPGRLCAELAERGWTVTGIDASRQMVEVARRRLPLVAERLLQADIEAVPFRNGSFDAVAATGVLEYVNLAQALSELVRVLRPGGRLVVSYPNPHAIYGIWKSQVYYRSVRTLKRLARRPDHWLPRGGRTVAPRQFTEQLRSHGLEIESVEHSSYLVVPTPLDGLLPVWTARVGARLEGSGPRLARVLATQVVYAARKPA